MPTKTSLIKFNNHSKFASFVSGIKDGSAFQLKLRDRINAGRILAKILLANQSSLRHRNKNESSPALAVFGIPRGGIVVADSVATALDAQFLDIVISRKLRAPDNKENAIGAVAPDGSLYLDEFMVGSLRVSFDYIEKEKNEQLTEIARRAAAYTSSQSGSMINERILQNTKEIGIDALLVDDGIASGATAIASARWVTSAYHPRKLTIATPVASKQSVDLLRNLGYSVESIVTPSNFGSVADFYNDFDQATDEKVIEILQKRNGRG